MPDIVLATINARYVHASLGMRCLFANLGDLQARARIVEFVSGAGIESMLERLLALRPRVVGFGVYVWNADETTRLVAQLKRVAPDVRVVVGGPEVSHEPDEQRICALADFVVSGPGELVFAQLCRQLLQGPRPLMKRIAGATPDLDALASPYPYYDDRDVRERFLYVEASRGCPFKCEFCLSSLDRTAEPFDLHRFLADLDALHRRGARRFKFVDRTFNLKAATGAAILEFFLQRLEATPDDPVFAHFELVPDHLPQRLKDVIVRFPPGTLQFEIGIQTWNPDVQTLISRRQDDDRAQDNLRWLRSHTNAHLHVDLIAGLPGENLASFGAGFDRLVALDPHEIQVGVLKRLRGAPIARHTASHALVFNPDPPYNVLATADLPFAEVQRVTRFARYWDLIGNSGRFLRTRALLLGDRPFERFMALSDWLYAQTDATHRLSAERQFELVRAWLLGPGLPRVGSVDILGSANASGMVDALRSADALGAVDDFDAAKAVDTAITHDYAASGLRGRPSFLSRGVSASGRPSATPARQARHLG